MTDYISREMTIDAICRLCNANFEEDPCEPSECEMMSLLRKIPAADVRPVVKARIVDMRYAEDDGEWKCTHCGWQYTLCVCGKDVTSKINFCPNCGADMMEES